MRNRIDRAIAIAAAGLAGLLPESAHADPPAPPNDPPFEVIYIPQEEFARAPGAAPDGVFLPLSQLTSLVRDAQRKSDAAPAAAAVYCKSIKLAGALDGESLGAALRMEGTLEFESSSESWSAARIADGAMPWTGQERAAAGGPAAFLARIDGRDWLFAKGPGRGSIALRALVAAKGGPAETMLDFGKFDAPCEIAIKLARGVSLAAGDGAEIRGEGDAREARLWPSSKSAGTLRLRRAPEVAGGAELRFKLNRVVSAAGMGLTIEDNLILNGRFEAGKPVALPLPPGLVPIRAGGAEGSTAEFADGALIVTPEKDSEMLAVTAIFSAEMKGNRATLGAWGMSGAAAQRATLAISRKRTDAFIVSPLSLPEPLALASASQTERRYDCWGALPAIEVELLPKLVAAPPAVVGTLALSPGEATVAYAVRFLDSETSELLFETPEGWSLVQAYAQRGAENVSASLQSRPDRRWRATWKAGQAPNLLNLSLHRAGDWGAPGTDAELTLPMLKIDGERQGSHEISVKWPESIEARAEALEQLRPAEIAGDAKLALRSEGPNPSGKLMIHGRESDARATILAALSIDEDRASVRAQIKYTIRFAPTHTFRFTLPARTGDVRIDGEGIRERSLRSDDFGDHWTVVTQAGRMGEFALELQWTLKGSPADGPVDAPEIRADGVASQRGYIALEASETLKLTAEAKGLAETGIEELPSAPWRAAGRTLAAYRFIEPPYSLAVRAERFRPEPGLLGVAREAELATAVSPDGERLTRATYTLASTRDRQFFEFQLPDGAQLWSVLVDGEGAKPATRAGEGGARLLLVPLPAGSGQDRRVTALYRERSAPLTRSTRLLIAAPKLPFPVNRTVWDVSLPPGFEWLAYGGDFMEIQPARLSLVAWLRAAYYPSRLLSGMSATALLFWATAALVAALLWRRRAERLREQGRAPILTGGRVLFYLVVAAIVAILAALAVPNFMEAQVRSKVSRVKADQRSFATALESYYVDNNAYPPDPEILWQGPVKYMNSPYYDPYAAGSEYGGGAAYRYKFGRDAIEAAARAGILDPGSASDPGGFWMAYSVGPDGRDDGGAVLYDPTNGSDSRGDVVRVSQGISFDSRFSEMDSGTGYVKSRPEAGQSRAFFAQSNVERLREQRQPMQMPQTAASNAMEPQDSPVQTNDENHVQGRARRMVGQLAMPDAPGAPPQPAAEAAPAMPQSAAEEGKSNAGPPSQEIALSPANSTSDSLSGGARLADAIQLDFENDHNAPSGWMDGAAAGKPATTAAAETMPQAARRQREAVYDRASEAIAGDMERRGGSGVVALNDAIDLDATVADDNTADGDVQWSGVGDQSRITINGAVQLSGVAPGLVARRSREAGLLSLDIELPRGGSERRFETLGEAGRVDVRLLEGKQFLRFRFAIWLAVALALAAVRLYSPRAYRRAFVATLAAALLVPAVWPSSWNAFFNAAAVGVLVSLLAPALGAFSGRPSGRAPIRAAAMLAIAFGSLHSASAAHADEPATAISMQAQTPTVADDSDGMSGQSPDLRRVFLGGGAPPRIVVPYNPDNPLALPPHILSDPLAFMNRETFKRLWEEAQGGQPVPGGPRMRSALVESISLDGALDAAASAIEGTLAIRAASLDDAPTTAALKLGSLALKSVAASEPGATLESGPGGLLLRLAPRWAGTIAAEFTARCSVAGATGSADFEFPETAAGLWRVALPYADAASSGAGIVERGGGKAALIGAIRPGVAHLAWSAAAPRRAADGAADSPWRAEIETSVIWHDLASAEWSTTFIAQAPGSGALLPARLVCKLDPSVRVIGAEGEGLLGATAGGGEIAFDIVPAPSAKIVIRAIVAPPATPGAWTISGLQAPEGAESRTLLWIYVGDQIELGAVEPKALERKEEPPAKEKDRAMRLRYAAASEPWSARLELSRARPSFTAEARSAFVPAEGKLWSAHRISVNPRGGPLRSIEIKLPPGARALSVDTSGGTEPWIQFGDTVSIAFERPHAGGATAQIVAAQESVGAAFSIAPLGIVGASDARRSAFVALPVDLELKEIDLAGASPQPPGADDEELFALATQRLRNAAEFSGGPRRAFALGEGSPQFEAAPAPLQSATTIHNRVTVSEGLVSLEAVARAEPRRGRIREVAATLLLPAPDAGVPTRLQAIGPVRRMRTDPAGDRRWRVTAELDGPKSATVLVKFQLDTAAGADASAPLGAPLMLPEGAGERAFLLLRREFEGELAGAPHAALRAADPSSIAWPESSFDPRPSDQVFELSPATLLADSGAAPEFKIVRHAREAALRAVVDLLRQRTILAPDGVERHELELVVQNQSEQFLRIALPYPKSQVTIYETRVAGRPAKAAVEEVAGRTVVSAPLVRTGLLEPELTVRVAYTVRGREPMRGSGSREQRLPEILGGVPVAQSALILMVPPGVETSRFKGTLSPIDLADLEIEEAKLKAENLRKLSEAALQTTGEKQREALSSLNAYQAEVASKLETANRLNRAYERNEGQSPESKDKADSGRKKALKGERAAKSAQAMQEQQATFQNQARLVERVQQLDVAQVPSQTASQTASQTSSQIPPQTASQTPGLSPPATPLPTPPPAAAPIEFPRVGEVFVFRQIQGTGNVTFKFASRAAAGKRKDTLFGIVAALGAAAALALGRRAFATRRRSGLLLLAACVAAGLAKFAVDLAIPGFAIAIWLLATARPQREAAAARDAAS